jgi:undecaprenyl diphosphate synthase
MIQNVPKHVAVIMDGNGRWAKVRNRPRIWGHVRGSGIVSEIVEAADDLGVKALTMYAFSTENWSRPLTEVKILFALLRKFLLKEKPRIIKNKIQFKIIGDLTGLNKETQKLIKDLEHETKDFSGLKLTFAFGYGSRNEIVSAVNSFITNNPDKHINEAELNSALYNPAAGDVDLLIRTGGDLRISNFLLWQSAYAELHFTKTQWPDFSVKEFTEILQEVALRERRFGAINSTSDLAVTTLMAHDNLKILQESSSIH